MGWGQILDLTQPGHGWCQTGQDTLSFTPLQDGGGLVLVRATTGNLEILP